MPLLANGGEHRRHDGPLVRVSIALCQFVEQVVKFGVYGEVENGSEDFRWEELGRRDGAASGAQAGRVLGEPDLLYTGISF